uniref:7TM_GPCR_Srx domain-containing protein n=1 Tax=Meloidogyne hapla TaxID=6305 RepID=A0A1I8B794_MELHA
MDNLVSSHGMGWQILAHSTFYIRTKRQRFLECMLVATASAFIGSITLLLIDDCQSMY